MLGLVLLPGSAWACGVCTELLVRSIAWWAVVPLGACLGLMVDALLYRVACAVLRIELPPVRFLRTLIVSAGLVFLVAAGTGVTIPAVVLAAVLAVRFVRSLRFPRERFSAAQVRCIRWGRGALVGAFVVGHLWVARPSAIPTESLLESIATLPVVRSGDWMERELAERPDAIAAVEARIEQLRREHQGIESWRETRFRKLHERLGGPAEFRARFAKQ